MQIQRGNQRQYQNNAFEKNNVADDVAGMIADVAFQLSEQLTESRKLSQKTKMTNKLSQANTELYKINEELKTEFSDDPTNPEFKERQKQEFDSVFSSIEQGLSPYAKQEFNVKKQNLFAKYELSNAEWAIKTERNNVKTQAQSAIENDQKMAAVYGANGDVDGLVGLVELNGSNLFESLKETLGEPEAVKITKSYTSDAAKSFMNANIKANPQQSLELLENEAVQSVIGDVGEIQELKEAAITQLDKKRKQDFTLEIYDKIKEGGEVWQKAIDGDLSFIEMQDFFANNDLTHKEKTFIAKAAGYSTGFKFDESGNFIKTGKKKSSEEKKTISSVEKQANFSGLILEGSNLLSGHAFNELPEDIIEKGGVVGAAMEKVAQFQTKVNEAFSEGQITKTQWEEISNNYIPMVGNFLAENLQGLEQKSGFGFGDMLGYSQIKEAADSLARQSSTRTQTEKGLLYSNYFYELKQAVEDEGLNSIYELEGLGWFEQEEVYKNAYSEAVKRTKKTSASPFLWFEKDYPGYSSAIRSNLSQSSAEEAMNNISSKVYSSEKLPDVPKLIEEEMKNQTIKENKQLSGSDWKEVDGFKVRVKK